MTSSVHPHRYNFFRDTEFYSGNCGTQWYFAVVNHCGTPVRYPSNAVVAPRMTHDVLRWCASANISACRQEQGCSFCQCERGITSEWMALRLSLRRRLMGGVGSGSLSWSWQQRIPPACMFRETFYNDKERRQRKNNSYVIFSITSNFIVGFDEKAH